MNCRLRPFALFLLLSTPITLPTASSEAQPPATSDAVDAEARALFEAGRTAYNDARYEDALGYYQRSYELSHRALLLYNIGQCQDRLRRDADAIASFEAFLAALPDVPQRAEVTARLEILRSAAEAGTRAPEAEPSAEVMDEPETIDETEATDAPPPVESSGSDPSPWIVLGVGGGLAVVGALVLVGGYVNIATVESARNVPFSSVSDAYDAAPILTGTGWAALGVGVALAGVGLAWGLSIGNDSNEHARLRIGPTGITMSGSF